MSIPSSEREQILVSSTNNERQSQAVVVKGTYWNIYSAFGNLHMHEFGGAYALRISASTPQFHVTNALDEFGVLRTDRFWLWKIDTSNNLDLVEIEPVVNGDPITHSTTRIDTGVSNIRANVSDGKPVVVYTVTTTPDLIVKIYTDIMSATPDKTVNMNWSGTRLADLDSESYNDQIRVAFIDVLSPPNVYVEDYELSTPEIVTYAQIPDMLQVELEWEEVDGAEAYRVERSIDDPLFTSPDVIYNGPLLAFIDSVPSWNTSYYYRAKIEVPSLGLESTWSAIQRVDVGAPALVADFDSDVTSGDADLIVNFTDESAGTPETWDWDFGDGSTHSFVQNPQHTYDRAGTYTVSLTVTSPGASDTETKTDYITVNMVAEFSADVTSGDAPLDVQFTDETLGTPDTWDWDFGDGTPIVHTQNPLHTYAKAGTFTVTLTASNSDASDAMSKSAYITVAMIADFTSDVGSGDAPLSVNFVDETTGEPDTWDWDFGDGSPHSDLQNPNHVYTRAGEYDVTLIASNSEGATDAVDKVAFINVEMVAEFSAVPVTGDNPLDVQFTDETEGEPTSWDWDFGDDTPHSNVQNPLHSYAAPGAHTVILVASNSEKLGSETKIEYITVGPIAEFSGEPRTGSAGLMVHFTDESTEGCTAWEWDFGDGSPHSFEQNPIHKYENNGQYDVTLTSTNIYGSGTTTKLNYIQIEFVFDDPYEPIDEDQCVGTKPAKVTFWEYLSTFWNNLDEKSRDAFENFWDGMVRAGNHLKKIATRFVDAQAPENSQTCILEDYYDIKIGPLYSIPINLDPTNKNPQHLITPIERILVDPDYNEYNDRIYNDRLSISASDYYKIRNVGRNTYAVVEPKDKSIAPKWFKVKNLLSSEEVDGPPYYRYVNPTSDSVGTYIVELVNADLAYLDNKPFTFYLTTARSYAVQPWVIELPYLQINVSTKEEYDFTHSIDYVLYNNTVEFTRDIIASGEIPADASVYCRWTKAMEYMLFEMYGSIVGIPDWQAYNYGNISGKTAINSLLKSLQNPTNREEMERAVHVYYGLPIAPDDSEVIGLYESYGYEINYVGTGPEEGWIQLNIKSGTDLHPFIQVGSRLHIDGKKDLIISEIDPNRALAMVKVTDASQVVLKDECYLRLRNSFAINRVYAESGDAAKVDIVSPEGGEAIKHIISVVQARSGGTRYPEIVVYGTGESAGNYDGIYHVTDAVTDGQIVTLSLYKKPTKGNALYNDYIDDDAQNLRTGMVHIPWPTHKFLLLQMADKYFKAYLDAPIDTMYDANDKIEKYKPIASNVAIVNNEMFEAWDEFDHFKLENRIHRENTMLQLVYSIPDARFGEYFPSSFIVYF